VVTSGIPRDLDDETLRRVARSLYVVRMARYALLLISALGIGAASAAKDAPVAVPVTLAALAVVFGALMVLTAVYYRRQARS
jgi:hypothetical protein